MIFFQGISTLSFQKTNAEINGTIGKSSARGYLWCTNELGCDYYEGLDDFDSENFEVIGNIIDNPELLEVRL